ncbi:hypothetical protein SADUNF_Sadunf06G0093200 [Salix dunnii]|uniref:C2H2-type domain-containing protein n=1 Tax=Salix dunnii TaxID=1413687 RepID=A0A835K3U4_9ROSI|nr:hypothetical protein SADUNF_Sadunf06G0093200 [Salix dunnii]
MEFWGVEVKSGEPLRVESGDGFILHLSQACLGEAKKDKGNESVCIYVNFDDQKLVLGTLSHDKIPQIPFDLVFEKDFELSHNLKNGSVYFSGYKFYNSHITEFNSDGEEDLPVLVDNEAKQPKPEKENPAKPDSKQKVKIVEPSKDGKPKPENDDSSDEEDDSSDDGESSDDQAEVGKKRSTESASKSPVPDKKAKFVTPQKTDLKKVGVHIATPHPSKQAAKTSANRQKMEQAQKSFSCNSCNRSFGSENALQSHSKAKHEYVKDTGSEARNYGESKAS